MNKSLGLRSLLASYGSSESSSEEEEQQNNQIESPNNLTVTTNTTTTTTTTNATEGIDYDGDLKVLNTASITIVSSNQSEKDNKTQLPAGATSTFDNGGDVKDSSSLSQSKKDIVAVTTITTNEGVVNVTKLKENDNPNPDSKASTSVITNQDKNTNNEVELQVDSESKPKHNYPFSKAQYIQLPPSPPQETVNELIAKQVENILQSGESLNRALQTKTRYKNPYICEKWVQHLGLDEFGTNYPVPFFDKQDFSENAYYDNIAKDIRKRSALKSASNPNPNPKPKSLISNTATTTTSTTNNDNSKLSMAQRISKSMMRHHTAHKAKKSRWG